MSICTFNYEKARGLQVRVFRNGKTITKFFAYKKYGGKAKTFALARQTERRLEKLYPETPSRKKKFHAEKPNRNNTSGIVGIRAFILKKRGRCPTIQFHSAWNAGRLQRSAQKHGLLNALQQVLDARQQATKLSMPTARKAWEIIKRNKGW